MSPPTRFGLSASRSTGEIATRFSVAPRRGSRSTSPSRATIRSAYASRSVSVHVPSPTSISPAASPLTRPAGSSWSWIQMIDLPSGAREGSSATGCPQTIVASAGSSPRSASFTARETPSRPGVTWTIGQRARRSASAPAPARRLVEREVDLHLGAAVAESRRCVGDGGRHVRAAEQRAVELGRRHAGDDGARRGRRARRRRGERRSRGRSRRESVARRASRRTSPPASVTIPASASTSRIAAADRHRHAAELERGGDHLRHEARRRLIRAEARVQHPRREDAARRLGLRTSS